MSFTREQLALIAKSKPQSVKAAKTKQAKQAKTRKGYVKALPMSPLTPKADQSRWALLAKGTVSSHKRACDQTDARPKAQLGDRRLMNDLANVTTEDLLYKVDKSLKLVDLFIEFLRIRKLRHDREAVTALEGRINAKQYRQLKYHIANGHQDGIARVLEQALNNNQIR